MKVKEFFREVGSGYSRFLKWAVVVILFAGLLILFNYFTILPLRTLAVNYRPIYNSITITIIGLLLMTGIVRWIIKTGWLQCLIFILFAAVLFVLIILPENFSQLSSILTIPYLLILYIAKIRKILKRGMVTLLILLCYVMGFYRITVLFYIQWYFLAVPVTLFYLLFLGFILYEKRIHTDNKIFM